MYVCYSMYCTYEIILQTGFYVITNTEHIVRLFLLYFSGEKYVQMISFCFTKFGKCQKLTRN